MLDIKYATSNNFSGVAVYKTQQAFARKEVVASLKSIQDSLAQFGLGLKIFDAYRPYQITKLFWDITPAEKKEFVANPMNGSRHNRGCAVDVTLINLSTKQELEMPTLFDSFEQEAYADYQNLPENKIKNRKLLQDAMLLHGFKKIKSEWWHFDFNSWENYSLMDISFKQLSSPNK